jgi:GDPmannose 4,6-dehydratase
MKRAVVTGVTGQDGAYLTGLLLEKGYKVFGTYRRSSSRNFWRLEELGVLDHPNLELVEFDLTDASQAVRLIEETQPDEVYNLAAQSFVGASFQEPIATAYATGLGPLHLLEGIRIVNPKIKFYQASSSEMFGKVQEVPQRETTPFYPRSPYGVSKLFAHWITINYRESYGIFGVSGILFNHESPLRGLEFVTRKITDGVAKIELGLAEKLVLGNLSAKRDWGYAKEYMEGVYLMLQQPEPETYILATNRTTSVREFVRLAFEEVGREIEFVGEGVEERGIDRKSGKVVVEVSPKFFRPAEVDLLQGDYSRAKEKLGWEPRTSLKELVSLMVQRDLERNREGRVF